MWFHFAENEFMKDKHMPSYTTMFIDTEILFHLLQQNPIRTCTNPFKEKLKHCFQ